MDTAGLAVATALNLSGEGLDVAVERTKGSPANLLNLCDGDLDLAMVSGDAAYWAWNGEGIFEGEPKKEFRVLAACYPVMSCFLGADSSLSYVHDLKGKVLSIGTEGSDTAQASAAVFSVLGIDETNTELWNYGLSGGAGGIRDGWADGIHGFSRMPVSSWLELFGEEKPVVLKYTEEELARLLEENPVWQRLSLPKDTYPGQTEAVETFGFKVLLCVPASMDEALAYEITKALDTKGEPVLSGHAFLKSMEQKEFLCHDLPAPLHPGAERYYKECGYIR